MKFAAVTFDFWNTLVRADVEATAQRRREAWVSVLARQQVPIEAEVVDAVLRHVSERHWAGWSENTQYTAQHAAEEAFALLGEVVGEDARQDLWEAWLGASRRADIELTPGLPDVLAALDGAGVRIGIVCDVGLTPSLVLLEFLERHDVLRHFDHWSFSDEVGVYKPDAKIFRHALEGLDVEDPSDALHIGDLRRTDVAGAQASGMTAVRYRGVFDDPPSEPHVEGDAVVDDLAELLTIVGLD
jgi:HAD superfamily hydrolase (TIGR01549 family)